ncbi:hypothetical protein ACJX0J_016219, partial [Zea mays]
MRDLYKISSYKILSNIKNIKFDILLDYITKHEILMYNLFMELLIVTILFHTIISLFLIDLNLVLGFISCQLSQILDVLDNDADIYKIQYFGDIGLVQIV